MGRFGIGNTCRLLYSLILLLSSKGRLPLSRISASDGQGNSFELWNGVSLASDKLNATVLYKLSTGAARDDLPHLTLSYKPGQAMPVPRTPAWADN